MSGSAIHGVRSQCYRQWEMRKFAPSPLQNPCTNLDAVWSISSHGFNVQNLIWINSAVTALHAWKTRFGVVWIFLLTYPLLYRGYRSRCWSNS